MENKNYTGEYFKANYAEVDGRDIWYIARIDPYKYLCLTYLYESAVELVNWLDISRGEEGE